jgi:hypothetical protein
MTPRANLQVNASTEFRAPTRPTVAVEICALVLRLSRTVRDLVVGSDIMLEDRGTHPLKGVQGSWQLFAVVNR